MLKEQVSRKLHYENEIKFDVKWILFHFSNCENITLL